MTTYEEILDKAKELSSEERLRLAEALLEQEVGFGMWRDRTEMADVEAYVEQIRNADMLDVRAPDGRLKQPEEFLREVETFDK